MIQVLPEKNTQNLIKLYKERNIEFSDNSMAVVARDGDEVLGLCLFEITGGTETVLHIEPVNDVMMADGILRSALHVGVTKNVTKAYYGGKLDDSLFKKLKFLGEEEKSLRIEKLFESCCSCAK